MFLNDIGEGSNALFCLTNRTLCCTTEAGLNQGGWRFPNDTSVTLDDTSLNFYRIRGYSSVHLNRRSDAVAPTGIFTCRIPINQSETNTNLYIGVYDDAGEGTCVIGMHRLLYKVYLYSCKNHREQSLPTRRNDCNHMFNSSSSAVHPVAR